MIFFCFPCIVPVHNFADGNTLPNFAKTVNSLVHVFYIYIYKVFRNENTLFKIFRHVAFVSYSSLNGVDVRVAW